MKVLAFLSILVVVSQAREYTAEEQAMYQQIVSSCASKEGASSDDVSVLINRDIPTTRSGNCLHACVMEKVGLISGGKPSAEGTAALADASGAEPSRIALAKEVAVECSSVSDPDRCTLAVKIIECSVKAATARGLDPKHMLD